MNRIGMDREGGQGFHALTVQMSQVAWMGLIHLSLPEHSVGKFLDKAMLHAWQHKRRLAQMICISVPCYT